MKITIKEDNKNVQEITYKYNRDIVNLVKLLYNTNFERK